MSFGVNDITGAVSGLSSINVWDSQGRLKVIGGGTPPPPAPVVWGTITGLVTNQTDLITYLSGNYYPLSSNPAGYLTQTAADLLYYPLSSNPAGYITAAALTGYVPTTRTLTINGTSYDLSADRSWTIPAGGTVTSVELAAGTGISLSGTNPITVSGTITVTNDAPDQVVSLSTTGTGLLVTGTYPTFTLENTLPDEIVSLTTTGTGLSVTGTYPSFTLENTAPGTTYTVDNGLTENPAGNFQLGGSLIQDTAIDGVGSGTWMLDFVNLHSSTNTARYLYSFATNHGGSNTLLSLDSNSNVSRFSHEDGGTTTVSAIELTGTELRVQTPGYATATNGDVLTLIDNTTGEAEWQTPTSGGGILHGTATGTDTYAVTITGATAYADGDAYLIRFTNGNTTGATLNINGQGAIPLYRNNDGALIGGDIIDGGEMLCVYNSTTNRFQVIGTAPNTLLGYVTNGESITITKGQAVYAFSGTGDRMVVKLANNTGDATSAQTVGLVLSTSIAANQKGLIMMQGLLDGLNILPTATYNDGDPIFLGPTPGSITKTKPYAPNHLVYLGVVTTASNGNAGRMYVKVQNGYELDELHNVQAQSPTVNDVLYFFGGSPGQWKTASLSTILGYTPVPDSRTLTINGTSYDLTADRSWTVTAAVGDLPEISVSTANAREDNYAPTGWPGATDIVKVIRINSTNTNYMMSLGGLASPSAGRIVTIYNASTANNLIIIENLSTSSTAANRFRMTGNLSYFLLPNRSVTFIYDGTYWTQMSASNTGGLDLFDDMTSGGSAFAASGSTSLHGILGSGTSAGIRPDTVSTDGFGELSFSTGSTATGFAAISSQIRRNGGNNAFAGYVGTNSIPYLVVSRVFITTLATGAQDYRVHFGMNGTSSLPTNAPGIGYLWLYPGSAATFWDVASSNVTTTTTVTTSLPITANTWYWLGVYKPGGATTRDAVYFYSTNGVIYTAASKFTGVTGVYGGSPTLVLGSTVGTTAKSMYCDWMGSSFNWTR